MDSFYFFAPIMGYLSAGSIKFLLNSLKSGVWAYKEIGMGSMPSTHNTITSATFFCIGFGEGFSSPMCSVALAVMIVVAIDSLDLRAKIETHAKILSDQFSQSNNQALSLRLKISHSISEVFGGFVLGAIIGYWLVILHPVL